MKGIELKKLFPHFRYSGNFNAEFSRIEIDSRKIKKGDLFVAIKGNNFDSHTKIREALGNGATVIISEKEVALPENVLLVVVPESRSAYAEVSSAFFNFPSKKLKVVGITGTAGKTSTAYLLYSFFNRIGAKSGFIGTIGEDTGDGLVLKEKFPPTTPDAFYLNGALNEMVNKGLEYAFVEVSSSAVLFRRINGIKFYSKILTNIGRDHLEVHGTFQNYISCKLKFFEGNTPAILNADSQFSEIFASIAKKYKTYGINNTADFRARITDKNEAGIHFSILYSGKSTNMFLRAKGVFNLYNFLALFSFSYLEGIDVSQIKLFAEECPEIPGRMHTLHTNKGKIIIDFAHNPDEIKAVLTYANSIKKNRLITITGAVGWSTKEKRHRIGKVASDLSDILIITTDDPRGDDPDEIINDVREAASGNVFVEEDRFSAIKKALKLMDYGDVVAVLGRGEEREIHFKDRTVLKSDEECVKEYINEANS